ncbi:acetyl-CoA carboxylase biotin carboxyl carrier protein [Campylobacter insulaenigrae]|uniref:Biotin carboxyl carrier protein of acetyl-CoA carboxylase n=1 Tax=Campylobacter insulaenigrae NCTC 12927 TaxID=1031564 RepID=A0A0A8H3F3_9BACT|nr:acetyl-CoA carboxylase biotin carboxyl carrier protein [Campylobacter insulaenigrae]AJC88215.1 acetyl-CoA carboxylase, biotin carboxyl carrier protein [Campylobacter insulaenigrae NCTC 12927]MCR6591408.1 acetyl-CoA carboxylase biotin carboxyl carrier protein [Campylobacter insulaenigrae]MCR6592991.1 acetyl-CoA carboxylase biotin carboxyl carrier protein [Campylobacter insulaenigrae]MCR6594782.1 acetyl-CoA carboxylase biotin carboxyl carrier protein [Campylobacter insulaenigrae]VEH95313.1 ac
MTKEEIKELMELFAKANVSKIKIKEQDGFEIELEKDLCCELPAPAPVVPAPQPINVNVVNETKTNQNSNKPTINSPMVGTFYQAPSPGAAPFAKVGQTIKSGSTIAIIEAMKIMNEIEAEYDCRIVEVLVADGQPVEFGMPLFMVEKL